MNDPLEYLTIAEVAARLRLSPKTVKNKMADGVFQKGVHYFSPTGLGPRFKWSAVIKWLEQAEVVPSQDDMDAIPMARGYRMGQARNKNRMAA